MDTAKRAFIQGRRVFAIQWDFVGQQWRKSEVSGNTQLFRELIAQPIPGKPAKNLEDIGKEFKEIIENIKPKHLDKK